MDDNSVPPNGYMLGFKISKSEGISERIEFDLIAKSGFLTENLFKFEFSESTSKGYFSVDSNGKLILRFDAKDESGPLDCQLLSYLANHPELVYPALLNERSLIKTDVWVHKDLVDLQNNRFIFKDAQYRKTMKENGNPAIIKRTPSPLVIKDYVKLDYNRLQNFISNADPDIKNNLISLDAGSLLLLPDGNYIVSLNNHPKSTYILDGVHFIRAILEMTPERTWTLAWEGKSGNRLAFDSCFVYEPHRFLRFSGSGLSFINVKDIVYSLGTLKSLDYKALDIIGKDFQYLGKVVDDIQTVGPKLLPLVGLYGPVKAILTDDILDLANNGKKRSDISAAVVSINKHLDSLSITYADLQKKDKKNKVIVIGKALGILFKTNPDELELQRVIKEIVGRIGPLVFIFILTGNFEVHSDGSWGFSSLPKETALLADICKGFNKRFTSHTKKSIDMLVGLLTSNRVLIDGEIFKFQNDFTILAPALKEVILNYRDLTQTKASLSMNYAQNFELAKTISLILDITLKKLDKLEGLTVKKLVSLKNEIRNLPILTKDNSYVKQILKNLIKNYHKIQAKKLGKSFEWLKFDDDLINQYGLETDALVLNKREISELYNKDLFLVDPTPSVNSRYYHVISYASGKQVRFEDILALLSMKSFTNGLYEALYPARNKNDKLFLRIDRNIYDQPSEAALFMADKDTSKNYWVFDFSKKEAWLEDPKNLDNVRRFYAALLMGQLIQFSTEPGNFDRTDSSYVGEFIVYGPIITPLESQDHAEDKQRIAKFIDTFLKNTLAPKSIKISGQKSNYLSTFRTESYPFFEELFKKGNSDNKVNEKFKLVQDCVDIKALNNILGPKGENNPKWNRFYERFTSDIHNRKFDNMLLSLFVNSIITIKDPSVAPNSYIIKNPDGSYQYLSPDQYDVHPEFYKALYFNRFGGY